MKEEDSDDVRSFTKWIKDHLTHTLRVTDLLLQTPRTAKQRWVNFVKGGGGENASEHHGAEVCVQLHMQRLISEVAALG